MVSARPETAETREKPAQFRRKTKNFFTAYLNLNKIDYNVPILELQGFTSCGLLEIYLY
jgi:ribosomal protein S18